MDAGSRTRRAGISVHRSVCHVQVQDLDAALSPVGSPRRLTTDPVWTIDGLTWTRDGTGVIYAAYSARQGSPVHLWRVDAAAARPPERIELAGRGVRSPTVAPTGYRLAYAQSIEDLDIYRSIRRVRAADRAVVRPGLPAAFFTGRAPYCLLLAAIE